MHNTGYSLDLLLRSKLKLQLEDGRAIIQLPVYYNGAAYPCSINLDAHETRVLAEVVKSIGADKAETTERALLREAQTGLEKFV